VQQSITAVMGWIAACVAASAALVACGDEPTITQAQRPIAGEDPVRQANDAREAIARGTLPANTDRLVARLDALRGSRREREASVAAAQLLHERFRRYRDSRDLAAAEQRWRALASGQDAASCDALARIGSLRHSAEDTDGARSAWLEYLRRCPDASAREHVRASLALIDPATARAATQATASDRRTTDGTSPRRSVRRVVIDAGHGGSDPGARGPTGLRESEVTLAVSRRVAERLAVEHGIDVVMTRDRDVFVPLEDRAQRANDARADLFVSIHCNAAERVEARGVSVYALDAQHERVENRFARRVSVERELDPIDDTEVSHILANLQLASQGARSWRLAGSVQRSLLSTLRAAYTDVDDMGVHVARFNVLVGTEMPAVLVELSFISNPMEESRLRDEGYQSQLARAVADAVAAGP
jgi:N-acetylmuramoyl-L-alanine amidase